MRNTVTRHFKGATTLTAKNKLRIGNNHPPGYAKPPPPPVPPAPPSSRCKEPAATCVAECEDVGRKLSDAIGELDNAKTTLECVWRDVLALCAGLRKP